MALRRRRDRHQRESTSGETSGEKSDIHIFRVAITGVTIPGGGGVQLGPIVTYYVVLRALAVLLNYVRYESN